MKLSETDKKILNSYISIVDGLAEYLGSGCEIVLHSLENYDFSVIKIVNGEYTGRTVGAPITNLALDLLKKIKEDGKHNSISYFTKNRKGEPLKSTTIAIFGDKGRIIGLLCINYYLNTPVYNFLSTFSPVIESNDVESKEIFSENTDEMIQKTIIDVKNTIINDKNILPSLKNKQIIERLNDVGIFNVKGSAKFVADELGISINTVYLHIRNMKK